MNKYETTSLNRKRHTLSYICKKYKKWKNVKYFDSIFYSFLIANILIITLLYSGFVFFLNIPFAQLGWYIHIFAVLILLFTVYLLIINKRVIFFETFMIIKRFPNKIKLFYDQIDLDYENRSTSTRSSTGRFEFFIPEPHVVLLYGSENERKKFSFLLTRRFLYILALKVNKLFPEFSGNDKSKLHLFIFDKNEILLDFLGKSDKEYLKQIKKENGERKE